MRQPLLSGLTQLLVIVCLGVGWRILAFEIRTDGKWLRIGLVALSRVQVFISLVSGIFQGAVSLTQPEMFMILMAGHSSFFQAVAGSLHQMFDPIGHIRSNSKTYSGAAPRRLAQDRHRLPHVTIQMSVFKEDLDAVIRPTVIFVKATISTYEMQGGTASIFVKDDGMQPVISAAKAQNRQEFFNEHQIGWVARTAHNSSS